MEQGKMLAKSLNEMEALGQSCVVDTSTNSYINKIGIAFFDYKMTNIFVENSLEELKNQCKSRPIVSFW